MLTKPTVGGGVTEIFHGVKIEDPYRWLEDRGSVETESWVEEQQQRHDEYFAKISEFGYLSSRVASYLSIESVDQPVRVAARLFYRRRQKGQEQACICMRDSQNGEEVILVDPSLFGKFCSVRIHRTSMDGTLLAYELRQGGSDAKAIHFVDAATRRILSDHLPTGYVRGVVLAPDNCGFYYTQDTDLPECTHTIRYHRFGEDAGDMELFSKSRIGMSRLTLIADGTRLGAFYVFDRGDDMAADLYWANFNVHRWTPVFSGRTLPCSPILVRGRIYLYSRDEAPNGKISELKDDGFGCRVLVPESEASIRQIAFTKDHIFTAYYVPGATVVRRWPLTGARSAHGETVSQLSAPDTIEFLPNLGCDLSSFFYSRESFTEPPEIREYREESRKANGLPQSISTDPGNQYRIDEVRFSSQDGTKIPMSLVAERDRNTGSPRPVIMTSYGGFGVSMTPTFSVLVAIVLELGAVFAIPNIRGGSEFGQRWHDAARGRNRQASFTDFICAAEWLCTEGVTAPKHIAIFGGSNSGLLVEAVAVQRPDLFGAVLCIAPILDMLRYERFDQARKWKHEYGSVEDVEDFEALLAYSPYHNVRSDVNYPSTLFVSGDKDDRCNPAHVRKMAARLQDRERQLNPILVDYSAERGHSPVMPLSFRIEALARRVAFLAKELNLLPALGDRNETTYL